MQLILETQLKIQVALVDVRQQQEEFMVADLAIPSPDTPTLLGLLL